MVDGPRPAVQWVAALPRTWTNDRERLVLLALACDSFDGETSRPGGPALLAWCGLLNGRLYETLGALERPNDVRPALIERVDGDGRTIPPGKRYGGARTGYRLRTDLDPQETISPDPPGESDSPDTPGESTGLELSRGTLPGNSPGKLSRGTLPAGRETPFPSLPSPNGQVDQPSTDRPRASAIDPWTEGEEEHAERLDDGVRQTHPILDAEGVDVGHVLAVTAARGGRWDARGVQRVADQLADRYGPAEALRRLLSAAADPQANTPVAATWDRHGKTAPPTIPGERCEHCGQYGREACERLQAKVTGEYADPHTYAPHAEAVAR